MMNTVEDFKNAPVGTTATHKATGNRAMKMDDSEQGWIIRVEDYLADEEMVSWGYTLDPIGPRPASAHEALDLAWELAHEVKPGQVIPWGTRLLKFEGPEILAYTAQRDLKIMSEFAATLRTLDPLPESEPEPEPDWLDAPAVMARVAGWPSYHDPQVFTRGNEIGTQWVLDTKFYHWSELVGVTPQFYHWSELVDVTPLCLKGQDA